MATKTNKVRESDTYLDMIRRFPLRPVRNDAEHAKAVEIIGELLSDDEHDADLRPRSQRLPRHASSCS